MDTCNFNDLYEFTGAILGEGSYAQVCEAKHKDTGAEYAVKVIKKGPRLSRAHVFREIELFQHCQGHRNIIQMADFFEEHDRYVSSLFIVYTVNAYD